MLTQCFWSPLVQLSFSLLPLSLSLLDSLFVSFFLPGHLPIWKDGKQRPDLHPPICPSGQSLFGKLGTDHVNRGQHVRWWTPVQMSPVETAVVCLLLRVFPALQGLLFPGTDRAHKDRAAHAAGLDAHTEQFLCFLRIVLLHLGNANSGSIFFYFLCHFIWLTTQSDSF